MTGSGYALIVREQFLTTATIDIKIIESLLPCSYLYNIAIVTGIIKFRFHLGGTSMNANLQRFDLYIIL